MSLSSRRTCSGASRKSRRNCSSVISRPISISTIRCAKCHHLARDPWASSGPGRGRSLELARVQGMSRKMHGTEPRWAR
jgi:hypothetical protein